MEPALAYGVGTLLVGIVVVQQLLLRRRRVQLRATPEVPVAASVDLALWAGGEELWDIDVVQRRMTRHGILPDARRRDAAPSGSLDEFVTSIHPDDRAVAAATLGRVMRGEEEIADASYRVGLRDGGWLWLHSRGRVAARGPDGRVSHVVGTTRAISVLKENEERLRLALEGAAEELWEVDLHAGTVRRENELPELDVGAGNLAELRKALVALMHPDDRLEVRRQFEAIAAGLSPEFRAAYRVRRTDGHWAWMSSQGRGVDPDAAGRPRRLIGTTRNVSEIKEGEERLRLALWGSRSELWDIDMTSGRIAREGDLSHLAVGKDGQPIQFRDLLAAAHPDDELALRKARCRMPRATCPVSKPRSGRATSRAIGVGCWPAVESPPATAKGGRHACLAPSTMSRRSSRWRPNCAGSTTSSSSASSNALRT